MKCSECNSENELTAVEYLESKIFGDKVFSLSKVFEKAKEMEKQQIQSAYANNCDFFSCENDKKDNCNCGKKYYEYKFKK